MLKLENVTSAYGAVEALRDVSLTIAAGEILGLLGRNGAGKTTLLKTIMGLIKARSGHIALDGAALTGRPAHHVPGLGVAYVPQGRGLFSEFSVAENEKGQGAEIQQCGSILLIVPPALSRVLRP